MCIREEHGRSSLSMSYCFDCQCLLLRHAPTLCMLRTRAAARYKLGKYSAAATDAAAALAIKERSDSGSQTLRLIMCTRAVGCCCCSAVADQLITPPSCTDSHLLHPHSRSLLRMQSHACQLMLRRSPRGAGQAQGGRQRPYAGCATRYQEH